MGNDAVRSSQAGVRGQGFSEDGGLRHVHVINREVLNITQLPVLAPACTEQAENLIDGFFIDA